MQVRGQMRIVNHGSTAVAFLRGVATLPPNVETEQLVVAAIRALAMMGDEGAATLPSCTGRMRLAIRKAIRSKRLHNWDTAPGRKLGAP